LHKPTIISFAKIQIKFKKDVQNAEKNACRTEKKHFSKKKGRFLFHFYYFCTQKQT